MSASSRSLQEHPSPRPCSSLHLAGEEMEAQSPHPHWAGLPCRAAWACRALPRTFSGSSVGVLLRRGGGCVCGCTGVSLAVCECVCACECGTLELPLLCPAPPRPESRPCQGFQEQERGERKGRSPPDSQGSAVHACTHIHTHPPLSQKSTTQAEAAPSAIPEGPSLKHAVHTPRSPLHLLLVLSAGRSPPPPSRSLPGGVGGRVGWASQRWVVCVPGELGGVVRGESGP